MESKVYTAQEMRELADKIWDYKTMSKGLELCDNELEQVDCEATHDLIYMLRQAADALEREEKREKRYEYAVMMPDGKTNTPLDDRRYQEKIAARNYEYGAILVRRELGEWEVVK